jgi:hypothetical protein
MQAALKNPGCLSEASSPDFSRPIASGSPKSQALIFLASSLYQDKEEDSTCKYIR